MRSNLSLVFSGSLILFSSAVLGNSLQQSTNNFEFSFVEGNLLNLNLGVEYGYIDNFLFQNSNESDTQYQKAAANIFLQTLTDKQLLQLSLDGESYFFDDFSDDNHSDLGVRGKYFYKLNDSHTLFSSVSYRKLFEYRGTGFTKGKPLSADKGDKYDDVLYNLGYRYGRFDSVSKVSVLVGGTDLEYKTRESDTRILDTSSKFAHLSIDYLLSGKTYISLATEFESVEYDNAYGQDRDQVAILAGIKWEASNLSQLTALLGYESLSFDESLLDDKDEFKWRISYDWSPVEYLKFSFKSGREDAQSTSTATNYVLKDTYTIAATYAYSLFTTLSLTAGYFEEKTNFIERTENEEYLSINGQYKYKFNHWLDVYAKAMFETRDSDVLVNEFDKSTIAVGINGTF